MLAIATPLLPVNQTTAELSWPQNDVLSSVDAPLIGYVATDLEISVPCSVAAGLDRPGRTVLLSTVPKQAPNAIDRGLLIERVNNDLLVIVRNTPVVSAPLSEVLSQECQELTFTAHADKVTGEFVGLTHGPDSESAGEPLRGDTPCAFHSRRIGPRLSRAAEAGRLSAGHLEARRGCDARQPRWADP